MGRTGHVQPEVPGEVLSCSVPPEESTHVSLHASCRQTRLGKHNEASVLCVALLKKEQSVTGQPNPLNKHMGALISTEGPVLLQDQLNARHPQSPSGH